jgi:hypothetical protein
MREMRGAYRVLVRTLVNAVMNIRVAQIAGNLLRDRVY